MRHHSLLLATDAELRDLLEQFSHERNIVAVGNITTEIRARAAHAPVQPRTTTATATEASR